MLREDCFSVFALAEHMIDFFEVFEVTLRKPFLVWDQKIDTGTMKPTGETTLQKDIRIELIFTTKHP